MHLCTCVSKEGGDGESAGSEALSQLAYTLRYVSLALSGLSIFLFSFFLFFSPEKTLLCDSEGRKTVSSSILAHHLPILFPEECCANIPFFLITD